MVEFWRYFEGGLDGGWRERKSRIAPELFTWATTDGGCHKYCRWSRFGGNVENRIPHSFLLPPLPHKQELVWVCSLIYPHRLKQSLTQGQYMDLNDWILISPQRGKIICPRSHSKCIVEGNSYSSSWVWHLQGPFLWGHPCLVSLKNSFNRFVVPCLQSPSKSNLHALKSEVEGSLVRSPSFSPARGPLVFLL